VNFLNPQFLWGLLLGIPLIAAYFLKVKPRKQPTNAWFLWEKVLAEKNSSSLFQKLRSFLSLLLMLLALTFLCFGLSDVRFSAKDNRDVFIVIDQSASMQAMSDGESSLDLAKNEAHAILNSLGSGQRASIVVLSNTLEYLTHLSSNAKELHDIVDGIEASALPDTSGAGRELTQMLESIEEEGDIRLVFISDGCSVFNLDDVENVEKVTVGSDSNKNVGIIAGDIQPSLTSGSATAMVQLSNASNSVTEVEVEIFHEDTQSIEELVKLTVNPGVNPPLFFELPEAKPGVWKARLLVEDDLAIDNEATMLLRPLPSVLVTIPEENNYFYQRCIEAFSKTSGSLLLSDGDSQVKIFHGQVPDDETGDIIIFAPSGDSSYWSSIGSEEAIHVAIAEQPNHGVLKHLNVNEFQFPAAKRMKPVESKAGQNIVVINLDPQKDDFFLNTGFVTLIYDSAMFLSGNETRLPATYPMGVEYVALNDSEYIQPSEESIKVKRGERILPQELGLYAASRDEEKTSFSTALLSAKESTLNSNSKNAMIQFSNFQHLWWLLPALVLLAIGFYTSLVDRPKTFKWLSFLLRVLAIAILVLGLCKPFQKGDAENIHVVFLVDGSSSISSEGIEDAAIKIEEGVSLLDSGDSYSIQLFDDKVEVSSIDELKSFAAAIAKDGAEAQKRASSDLPSALLSSRMKFEASKAKKIIVFSDGVSTEGGVSQAMESLENEGVEVKFQKIGSIENTEVSVVNFDSTVQTAFEGEIVRMEGEVATNKDMDVTVRLLHREIEVKRQKVKLEANKPNKIVFDVEMYTAGTTRWQMEVMAEEDYFLMNNAVSATVQVSGKPRVLAIHKDPKKMRSIARALRKQGIELDIRGVKGLPSSLEELLTFRAVLLCDVPATELTVPQMFNLKTYVAQMGGGLGMLGSENSFGIGGYHNTPVDEILPIASRYEKEKIKPSLAMALVIDKSGSMNGDPIALARQAAKSAVELLGVQDSIAVIGFDSNAQTIVPMSSASNKGAIKDSIDSLAAGGGTNLYPGLLRAQEMLDTTPAKIKHIIILSDGQTCFYSSTWWRC